MQENRLQYLDGLRAILAIIVFLHHYFYIFYPDIIFGGQYSEFLKPSLSFDKIMAFTPLNMLFNPGTAIHLFFILSAYVQSYHYFKNPDLQFVQMGFLKRYFRLALPTLAVLLLVFIVHRFNLTTKYLVPADPVTGSWTKSVMPDNLSLLAVIKHALYDSFLGTSRYYQILWTMPIELMNSWMTLIILFVTHQIKKKPFVILFWIIVQLFVMQSFYSVAFSIGLLICYAEIHSEKFRSFFSSKIVKYTALLIGIYFASYPFVGYQNSTVNSFYAPLSFFEKYPHIISYLIGDVLLFCFLLRANQFQKFLQKNILLFFGKISFQFYLVHLLVLLSFTPWIFHTLSSSMSKAANLVVSGLLSFLVITFVSHLLYRFLDVPMLKVLNRFVKKLFSNNVDSSISHE